MSACGQTSFHQLPTMGVEHSGDRPFIETDRAKSFADTNSEVNGNIYSPPTSTTTTDSDATGNNLSVQISSSAVTTSSSSLLSTSLHSHSNPYYHLYSHPPADNYNLSSLNGVYASIHRHKDHPKDLKGVTKPQARNTEGSRNHDLNRGSNQELNQELREDQNSPTTSCSSWESLPNTSSANVVSSDLYNPLQPTPCDTPNKEIENSVSVSTMAKDNGLHSFNLTPATGHVSYIKDTPHSTLTNGVPASDGHLGLRHHPATSLSSPQGVPPAHIPLLQTAPPTSEISLTSPRKISNNTNARDPSAIRSRVFVGNLNTFIITKEFVETVFQRYGTLAGVSMHKGYAFIQYTCEQDARSAVKGEDLKVYAAQAIDVNLVSEPKPNRPSRKKQNTTIINQRIPTLVTPVDATRAMTASGCVTLKRPAGDDITQSDTMKMLVCATCNARFSVAMDLVVHCQVIHQMSIIGPEQTQPTHVDRCESGGSESQLLEARQNVFHGTSTTANATTTITGPLGASNGLESSVTQPRLTLLSPRNTHLSPPPLPPLTLGVGNEASRGNRESQDDRGSYRDRRSHGDQRSQGSRERHGDQERHKDWGSHGERGSHGDQEIHGDQRNQGDRGSIWEQSRQEDRRSQEEQRSHEDQRSLEDQRNKEDQRNQEDRRSQGDRENSHNSRVAKDIDERRNRNGRSISENSSRHSREENYIGTNFPPCNLRNEDDTNPQADNETDLHDQTHNNLYDQSGSNYRNRNGNRKTRFDNDDFHNTHRKRNRKSRFESPPKNVSESSVASPELGIHGEAIFDNLQCQANGLGLDQNENDAGIGNLRHDTKDNNEPRVLGKDRHGNDIVSKFDNDTRAVNRRYRFDKNNKNNSGGNDRKCRYDKNEPVNDDRAQCNTRPNRCHKDWRFDEKRYPTRHDKRERIPPNKPHRPDRDRDRERPCRKRSLERPTTQDSDPKRPRERSLPERTLPTLPTLPNFSEAAQEDLAGVTQEELAVKFVENYVKQGLFNGLPNCDLDALMLQMQENGLGNDGTMPLPNGNGEGLNFDAGAFPLNAAPDDEVQGVQNALPCRVNTRDVDYRDDRKSSSSRNSRDFNDNGRNGRDNGRDRNRDLPKRPRDRGDRMDRNPSPPRNRAIVRDRPRDRNEINRYEDRNEVCGISNGEGMVKNRPHRDRANRNDRDDRNGWDGCTDRDDRTDMDNRNGRDDRNDRDDRNGWDNHTDRDNRNGWDERTDRDNRNGRDNRHYGVDRNYRDVRNDRGDPDERKRHMERNSRDRNGRDNNRNVRY